MKSRYAENADESKLVLEAISARSPFIGLYGSEISQAEAASSRRGRLLFTGESRRGGGAWNLARREIRFAADTRYASLAGCEMRAARATGEINKRLETRASDDVPRRSRGRRAPRRKRTTRDLLEMRWRCALDLR